MEQKKKQFDVVVIGAGVAGLSSAIRLQQKAKANNQSLSIAIVEKSSKISSHIFSGAIMDTAALFELFPDWQAKKAPLKNKVSKEKAVFITDNIIIPFLKPRDFTKKDSYIVSLGEICEWLASEAEQLGIDIFLKSSAIELVYDETDKVIGVATNEDVFLAEQIIIAEGANGFLAQKAIKKYHLDFGVNPQKYSLGFKEIWQIDGNNFAKGLAVDFFAKTQDKKNYIRGFIHHIKDNLVAIGAFIALDYRNPYLDPFKEFQNLKNNNNIKDLFENANRISFGAKVVPIGGYNSLPKLSFKGGVIIGDSAGFMNCSKLNAISNSMFSGIIAGDAILNHITKNQDSEPEPDFDKELRQADFVKDMYKYRNSRAGFKYGIIVGAVWFLFDYWFSKGKLDSIARNEYDYQKLKKAKKRLKIEYPSDDGVIVFDKSSSAYLTNLEYKKNAENHLLIENIDNWFKKNIKYDSPELRYCPAGVYEKIEEDNVSSLKINFNNCINCKTCEIKDPYQSIKCWPPINGGGTNYQKM